MSSSGTMPPPKTTMSLGVALGEQLDEPAEQRHVRAGEHREADQVGVLLDRGLHDLLGGLVQAGVDHLVAGVAQGPGHDLGAAVVTVEAGLGDDDPQHERRLADVTHATRRPRTAGPRASGGDRTGTPISPGPIPFRDSPGGSDFMAVTRPCTVVGR